MTRVVQRRSSARLQNNTNNNLNVIKNNSTVNFCSKQNELSNAAKVDEFIQNQHYSTSFYSNISNLRRNNTTDHNLDPTYNTTNICDKERHTTVIVVEELDCLRNVESENERNINSNSYGNSEGSLTPNSSLSSISSNSLLSNGYSLSPTRQRHIYNSAASTNTFLDSSDSSTIIRQNSNIYDSNSPNSVSTVSTIHCYDKTYGENNNSALSTYNLLTPSQNLVNIVNENIVNNNTVIVGSGCVDSTMSMSTTFLNNNSCLLTNNNNFDYRPQYASASTPNFDANENEVNNCGPGTYAGYYQASFYIKNFIKNILLAHHKLAT